MNPDPPAASSPAAERVGLVLKGKWHLDALIGIGGMAAVYAATHRNGSRVAIKMLNPEYAAQPDFVKRFMREGYVANKISHPSSVLVLDDDTDEGCAFLVMELLSGHSLERYARRGGARLPLGHILHIAEQTLGLLAVAHGVGILHRDIKPANIHVTTEGLVKVLDFGIARLAEQAGDRAATQTGTAIGTPAYMPPEQARGRWTMVDGRTDLWALGATIHALVAGTRPRVAETVQEEMLLAMTTPLTSLREIAPATPPALIEFVERSTAFDMNDRWPDAPTMLEALHAVTASVTSGAAPVLQLPVGTGGLTGRGEPGSRSVPGLDSARIVPPAPSARSASFPVLPAPAKPVERESSTLEATDAPARTGATGATGAAGPPRWFVPVVAAAVTLAVCGIVVLRISRRAPAAAETAFAGAPPPLPSSSARAAPPPSPAIPPELLAPMGEAPPEPAPAPSAAPSASAAAAPSASSRHHHRPRPGPHADPNSPLFDERF